MEMRLGIKKDEFSVDVSRSIHGLCETVFSIHTEAEMENVFGISKRQMEETIKTIIDAFPDDFLQRLTQKKLEELKTILAREYVFFQVQERGDETDYATNLASFIQIFLRDIQKRF